MHEMISLEQAEFWGHQRMSVFPITFDSSFVRYQVHTLPEILHFPLYRSPRGLYRSPPPHTHTHTSVTVRGPLTSSMSHWVTVSLSCCEECSDLLHVFLGLPSFSVAVEGPEISMSHRGIFSLYCRQGSSDLRQVSVGLPSLSRWGPPIFSTSHWVTVSLSCCRGVQRSPPCLLGSALVLSCRGGSRDLRVSPAHLLTLLPSRVQRSTSGLSGSSIALGLTVGVHRFTGSPPRSFAVRYPIHGYSWDDCGSLQTCLMRLHRQRLTSRDLSLSGLHFCSFMEFRVRCCCCCCCCD